MTTKKSHFILLTILAVVFFVLYSYLAIYATRSGNTILNSPDETANFLFIKRMASSQDLYIYEPLNQNIDPIVKPRSVNVYNNNLVPGGFLGLILIYGIIARVLGTGIVLYLTPIITAITVFFFYSIIKRIFNSSIALFASILFLSHPAVWYYSARGLLPNIVFVDFLIIGFYFLSIKQDIKRFANGSCLREIKQVFIIIFSALFIGLAISIRPSEALWIFVSLFIYVIFHRKKIRISQVITFLFVMFLIFIPTFYYNYKIYGSFLNTGYFASPNEFLPAEFYRVENHPILTAFISFFMPFGFNLKALIKNFYYYFIWIFWYLSLPAILGFILCMKKNIRDRLKTKYLIFSVLVFLFYIIYYGSWQVYDNISKEVTIGVSYVRYWLPIFVISLPFIAFFFNNISKSLKTKRVKISFLFFCFIVFFVLSSYTAFWGTNESLAQVRKNLVQYNAISKQVSQLTENDAVIITERSDKIFFPMRKVIDYSNTDIPLFENLEILHTRAPIYYFTNLSAYDIDYLNEKKLPKGLRFELKQPIENDYFLYQLKAVEERKSGQRG